MQSSSAAPAALCWLLSTVNEGSTESIYKPAYSQTLKEVLPKYQCSPALLRRKPEWGGSDPSINFGRPQSTVKVKRNNRRSCVPTSPMDNNTLDKDINHVCWMSSGDKKDLSHQMKVQNREMCKAPCQSRMLTRDDRGKELNSDRTQTDLQAQGGETAADTAESIHTTGKLKKLQNLVQTKKGHQSGAGKGKSTSENNDALSNNNPMLTCIGLGKRSEKKSSKAAPSPLQQQQQAKDVHEDSEEEGVWIPQAGHYLWNPFECPQPWTPLHHTCHQPQHELMVGGGTLSLPRTTEWDRFESLIQELDSKQSDLSPPQKICSITDQQLSQNTSTGFGRFDVFRQRSPLMKPQDDGSSLQKPEQIGDPTKVRLQRREKETSSHSDRKHVKASPEKTLTAISVCHALHKAYNGNTQKDEAQRREAGGGRPFTKGHRLSCNSLESLYSGQSSSSSGVTSGSGCSSNRDSLRLDEDLLYTKLFCGRARVHTNFVPSPYDTESLKLKVGDVIDIIAKPPMGIWTGMLNGRMGNFKFIYVDVLTEESPDTHKDTQTHRVRQKSTVQEVLKRLSLEEYSSSLQLNGYQTVDDLMRLREHHLTELNVTDPEHRHRLLAAVDSLQQLRSDRQLENEANQEAKTPRENTKADMNNCPRDSGCHMPSDSPDNSTEDTDLHCISEYPPPAETSAP
ncbi:SAM domain-containing protein SAMSN-1b isoform X1 [Micropterus salmoides]|uniref:SAM domain-containing protein SAMSN-1b isoform X1 n=1 Tax=Micropterus salmoides TaxID=27706 RepID=UPI0018EBE247|nr:SAM domain-containing protein SAMSN-1b isoform X1 [Micropterus salmoides]